MNLAEFESGFRPEGYVDALQNYRSFVRKLMPVASPNPGHVEQLKAAATEAAGELRATIMTEDWCGDSACNLPVLAPLFSEAGITLRILRGSENPGLKEYIENDTSAHAPTDHIPVLSVWDGEFNEIARWVEAPEAVTEKKDAWKAERPHFMELYARRAGDPEAAKEFAKLYREFLETMGEWYSAGLWDETTREVAERVSAATGYTPQA